MSAPLVKSWLPAFIATHEASHPSAQWPAKGSPSARALFSAWLNAFIDAQVTQAEARQASVMLDDGGWCEDHPSLVVDVVRGIRRQAREDEAQRAPEAKGKPVEESDEQRMATAGRLLDELYGLGWELRWDEGRGHFAAHRAADDAGRPSAELSARLREHRWEVYALLGHPMPTPDDFRDASGRFDWRRMVATLSGNLKGAKS